MNYRHAPPSQTYPQTTFFNAYRDFLKTKAAGDPPMIGPPKLVRLPEKIWPGQIALIGKPHYHFEGLELVPRHEVGGGPGPSLGNQVDISGVGQLGASVIPSPFSLPQLPFPQYQPQALSYPQATTLPQPPQPPLHVLSSQIHAPSVVYPSSNLSLPTQLQPTPALAANASSSSSNYTQCLGIGMSRRPSHNPPPLIEAALRQRSNSPVKAAQWESSVSMRASISNQSSNSVQSEDDWAHLRADRSRISELPQRECISFPSLSAALTRGRLCM